MLLLCVLFLVLQPRELYAMCLSHNICDTNEYQHAISLIRYFFGFFLFLSLFLST